MSKTTRFSANDFTNVREPGRGEIEAIEDGREPRRIHDVPSLDAVEGMYIEYVPQNLHYIGEDNSVARALGSLVL